MHKILFTALALLVCISASAIGAQRNTGEIYNTQVHNKSVGTASTAVYTAAIKIEAYTRKTVQFQGYSGATLLPSLPGTAVVQCSPTSSATGPWVTAKDHAGNAASATTSTMFNFEDFCPYYRIGWTKTGTDTKSLSSWLMYGPSN